MRRLLALLNARIHPWILGSVIAIGLGAFLLVAYRDLENRLRIVDAVNRALPVRTQIAEALKRKGDPIAGPRPVKGIVKAMRVEGDGRIIVQLSGYMGEDIRLTLTPLEIGETRDRWGCAASGLSRGGIPDICRDAP